LTSAQGGATVRELTNELFGTAELPGEENLMRSLAAALAEFERLELAASDPV